MNMQQFRKLLPSKKLQWILASAAILLTLSLIIGASWVRAVRQDENDPSESTDKPSPTEQSTVPPTDHSGLLYQSLGNGSCALIGMGSCTEAELVIPKKSPNGDLIVAIGERAFAECTSLVSVTIPADIRTIGEAAFMGCSSLVLIEVDRDNKNYCSIGGVLYSKDKTGLLCYPPNRAATQYLLNINVAKIAPYAFYGNRNLEHLLYEETVDSFHDIQIATGNSLLSTITITCNYVNAKG